MLGSGSHTRCFFAKDSASSSILSEMIEGSGSSKRVTKLHFLPDSLVQKSNFALAQLSTSERVVFDIVLQTPSKCLKGVDEKVYSEYAQDGENQCEVEYAA